MTLVEMTIALGLTMIVAGAACYSMIKMHTDLATSQSLANVFETQTLFKTWLSGEKSAGATCAQILKLNEPAFHSGAPTELKIVDPAGSRSYSSSDSLVAGNANFTITKIYDETPTFVRTETVAGVAQKIYLTTIWLEGVTANGLPFQRRPLTALTLRTDPAGQIIECNVPSADSGESNCARLAPGYVWSSGLCVASLQHDALGNFSCPSGYILNADGTCHPVAQACSGSQIAQTFVAGAAPTCITYH